MQGRCTVHAAVLQGVEALPVDVEVAVTSGVVVFNIVGMADAAVQEARERVRAALKVSGYEMPGDRVLVNLAPSDLKKTGSGLDLPIAVGLLAATGQVHPDAVADALFVGELSIDGGVRPVRGLLAYALCARDHGLALVCSDEAAGFGDVEGLRLRGLDCIGRLRTGEYLSLDARVWPDSANEPDFSEVAGHDVAKRAMQIAAAGNHGLLMMGPPGSGKTMLASRMPSILPPLTSDEAVQVALIHSVADLDPCPALSGRRPFRAPHHSMTAAGLMGGGSPIRPGEVSLAHNGVLMLDEIAECKPSVLQQLRQPLEEGAVRITRAGMTATFPARFMLIAASNPCPCGYFGDDAKECLCTEKQVRDYQNRIGGPLMDRIDLHIDVRRLPAGEVLAHEGGTSSETLRIGVMKGREYASWRKAREGDPKSSQALIASCKLSAEDEAFFERMAQANRMSGRGIVRTLSVARTVADMDERPSVSRADLCEALGFRLREGTGS